MDGREGDNLVQTLVTLSSSFIEIEMSATGALAPTSHPPPPPPF